MPRACAWLLLIGLVTACHRAPSKANAAAALAGIQPGEEREIDGVFLKMTRLQASEPLGDGWHLARAGEGGFTVELPLPFNELRARTQTTDHVELRSHTVGGKTAGLLAWSATCIARRDGKLDAAGRAPAAERYQVLGTPPKAHQRSIDLDDRTCTLMVEAQGTDPLPTEPERLRFLRSFKRTGRPTW